MPGFPICFPPRLSNLLATAWVAFLTTACARHPAEPPKEIRAIFMTGIYADSARFLAAEFQSQTGIRVHIVDAPYLSLREKEVTDLLTQAGGYDVLAIAQQWGGETQPHLLSLNRFIAADDPGIDDFIPAVRQNTGIWQDQIYALPMACDAITLFYRTDIFAARSNEFRQATGRPLVPPRTWSEYLDIARFFNTNGLYGNIIMGHKEQDFTVWSGIFWGLGGELVGADWEPTLNSAVGARSLALFAEMFKYAPPGAHTHGIEAANALFLQGKGTMYMTWPSLISAQLNNPAESKIVGKVGAAVIPGGQPQLSAWSLGIAKTCRDPALAYQWIKFYLNAANTKRLFVKYGKGSARTATYQDPELKASIFYLPQLLEGLKHCRPRFHIAASQELCDYLDAQIAEAITGRVSPQAALDATALKWRRILIGQRLIP